MSQLNSEVKALFVNNVQVPLKDGTFQWSRGGYQRDPVMGSGQKLGSTRAFQAGTCQFTIVYKRGTDLSAFDIENGQIRVQWDRGDEWVMTNADLQTPISGSAGDGDIELEFNGNPWKQTKLVA